MQVDARSIASHLASLAWVAVSSFLLTLAGLTLAGFLLAGLSFWFLYERDLLAAVVAAIVAVIEGIASGFFLGMKRAMVLTMAHGLARLRLGRSCVHLLFERMLGVAADELPGARGGQTAQFIERLPLAKAEDLLSRVVRDLTGDAARIGWLARQIQTRLLRAIQKFTLARFHAENGASAGIDLVKVQVELENNVDDALVRKVRGSLRIWMILVLIGLPFVVAVQTIIVLMILHSKG